MSMNGSKAANYMKEWMGLRAISSFLSTGKVLLGTAIDREGIRKEYMISLEADSEGQYNVFDRPIDKGNSISNYDWEWVDAVSEEITFNASKMERFIKKESLLAMVFKDLSARNKKNPKEDILETIFNSYVLDDSVMVREYNKA